jgi:Ca2+-binding EF-hand superfamily protein
VQFIKIMQRPVNGKKPDIEEGALVALFQAMDHNADGSVCYKEFAEAWAAEELEDASPEGLRALVAEEA